MEKERGIIIRIIPRKGYGFIQKHGDNVPLFFHAMGVCESKFKNLREGMEVEFLSTNSPGRNTRTAKINDSQQTAKSECHERTRAIGVIVINKNEKEIENVII